MAGNEAQEENLIRRDGTPHRLRAAGARLRAYAQTECWSVGLRFRPRLIHLERSQRNIYTVETVLRTVSAPQARKSESPTHAIPRD